MQLLRRLDRANPSFLLLQERQRWPDEGEHVARARDVHRRWDPVELAAVLVADGIHASEVLRSRRPPRLARERKDEGGHETARHEGPEDEERRRRGALHPVDYHAARVERAEPRRERRCVSFTKR